MSIEHEFCLVPKTVNYFERIMSGEKDSNTIDSITIPDDLIQYIRDSLNWIPSKNPAKSMTREEKGINYHGITLFDQTSAAVMKNVLAAWHNLFTNSPEKLELTGEFVLSSKKNTLGEYEGLIFNRNDVLALLERLISMIDRLKEENLFLYHLGI
ncbi:hypothetical protein QWY22_09225 [Planococcus liqunii]|uniref:hypothetical protein n=1 Tax=Planococcus liqunii TaxID=3058394 RepID=UPI0026195970|nr:hypothetical protein [Planococcus sp. N056]WKA52717.1 hypothetical protein QWY22_09225 [Planococcus sp. N056]